MSYKIRYTCISSAGEGVFPSQDNYCCKTNYRDCPENDRDIHIFSDISESFPTFFGVFDGIGGLPHGDAASCIAARTAAGFSFSGNPYYDMNLLCKKCSDNITAFIKENLIRGSGTTCAAVCFYESAIAVCNIGDSRVYRISDGKITQLSKDHVMLSRFNANRKPPLSQYLGLPDDEAVIAPHITLCGYRSGDIYIICSDGLSDVVSPGEIESLAASCPHDKLAEELMCAAINGRSRDNITIIVCAVE